MEFLNSFQLIFSDAIVFLAVQIIIVATVVFAVGEDRRSQAKRASISINPSHLVLAYSVVSASVIQSVSAAVLFSGYKMVITLADLAAAFYLCFYSPWFRGIVSRVLRTVENNSRRAAKA